ncbi:helix-turn-helix transcriptional regulator [Marinobacter nauticus]|uniref:helix-turn-helix transcriptional regulator n=1 Tax=Marinobacter nauticus TaxID=2743 RepID=UPI001F167AC3|nr:AlpA family phage regulatory protein [Marinobacter nauticus]
MNKQSAIPKSDRLMRLPEVVYLCQRSRTSIYNDVKAGRFPEPVRIGPRAIAWRESDVQEWIATGGAA